MSSMEKFDLLKFTEKYLEDGHQWHYLYNDTFYELKDLVDGPIDVTQYLVKEVSLSEMLAIIESRVTLDWFLTNDRGAAYVRKNDGQYELYYEGERGMGDQVVATGPDLRSIIVQKLRRDLSSVGVQLIKD